MIYFDGLPYDNEDILEHMREFQAVLEKGLSPYDFEKWTNLEGIVGDLTFSEYTALYYELKSEFGYDHIDEILMNVSADTQEAITIQNLFAKKHAEHEKENSSDESLMMSKTITVTIFQISKDCDMRHDIIFESYDTLKKMEIEPSADFYDMIWSGELPAEYGLDDIYTKFNIDHPQDFRGHSLSVSDVVCIRNTGDPEYETKAYYVDSFGFKELPAFAEEVFDENVADRLYKKLTGEFADYRSKLKQMDADGIIAEAYPCAIRKDILLMFENPEMFVSESEMSDMLKVPNLLDRLYKQYINGDYEERYVRSINECIGDYVKYGLSEDMKEFIDNKNLSSPEEKKMKRTGRSR